MFFYTFNGAASNPFSLTGPANCSIFGLHIHTHSYARLHTLTPSVTHTHSLTHSLEVGARSGRAISLAAADIIVREEGRRFHRQCARITHGESCTSLPVIPYRNGEGCWSQADADVDRQSGNHKPSPQTAGGEIFPSPSQWFQLDSPLRLNLVKICLYHPAGLCWRPALKLRVALGL